MFIVLAVHCTIRNAGVVNTISIKKSNNNNNNNNNNNHDCLPLHKLYSLLIVNTRHKQSKQFVPLLSSI